ncbi:MAG TPA: glutaredoxin family protein, partial [Burkholderiales bacterium]|nr:glutaredoxin family protein [Burkholderiales bacterium]
KITLGIATILFSGALAAAQLYRWVDEKGNVEWRDTPPPSGAKQVEQRNIRPNTIDTAGMPYAVKRAARDFPVTLWATNCGEPCDKARTHLARRGVPYTEKNPQSDLEAYKKLMGGLEIPVLVVGREQRKGYLESDWDDALDVAGYPRSAGPGTGAPPPAAPAKEPAPTAPPAAR